MPWKNQGGGPWGQGPKGPWGGGPQSVGPRPPDLEDLLRRGQDKLQQLLPGGHFSGMGIALVLVGALAIWGLSGFFRVQSEELGVVLRFGKHVRTVQPGLNYHLPYPIETVLLPKALRVSTLSIGMTLIDDPARRGRTMRDVPEESLMLTGDENIVDVDFTVLWRIKPDGVGNYLFNIQNPEGTVKAVAESAMREVIGRSQIQPILTGARTTTEQAVQELMQKTLDNYGSGVQITQVQMQKVDPPAQVIDAFRDVQAARADFERLQNEAQTYANRVVPDARGRAAQILQVAEGYKEQAVAEAKGQSARFTKVYDEYKKAPDVTRQRIYLETMERILGGSEKLVYDGGNSAQSIVPYLPLSELTPRRPPAPPATSQQQREARDEVSGYRHCHPDPAVRRRHRRLQLGLHGLADRTGAGGPARRAGRVVTEPGLNFKAPFIDTVISIDKRILDLENPSQEVIASDQKRLVVDAFARYRIKNALRFYQSIGSIQAANIQLTTLLNAALRRVLGEVTFITVVRDEREAPDDADPRPARQGGRSVRHPGGRRAYSPRRSAGAEQPGGLSAHADRTAARGRRVPRPGRPEGAGDPFQGRSRGDRHRRRCQFDRRADARRRRRRTQPPVRRGLWQGSGILRLLPFDVGLRDRASLQRHPLPAAAGFRVLPLLRQSVRPPAGGRGAEAVRTSGRDTRVTAKRTRFAGIKAKGA